MNKKIKIVLGLFLVLLVGIGSVFYFVSKKIDPQLIKAKTIQAIEKALPGSKVKISEVKYSLGFKVDLNIQGFNISNAKSNEVLFNVQELSVDVPILSILMNGGTVDVKVVSPELNLETFADGTNNWSKVLPAPSPNEAKTKDSSKSERNKAQGLELPSFVEKSKVDLKVSNLKLTFTQDKTKSTEVLVNKILLKDLNLKKTTAFEVMSNIDYGLDVGKNIKAKTQIIGEVALNKYIEEGIVDLNMMVGVEDIKLSWMPMKLPNLKNVIRLNMSSKQDVSGDIRSEGESLFELEAKYNVANNFTKVSITNINFALQLERLSKILKLDSGDSVVFNKSALGLRGSAGIDLKREIFSPGLSFMLTRPLEFNTQGKQVKSTLNGSFEGRVLSAKIKNELLSGVATLDVVTKLNPMKLPEEISNFEPIEMKLLVTNIILEKPFIQNILYSKSGDSKEKESDARAQSKTSSEGGVPSKIDFPPFNLKIEGKHIFIDKQEMLLSGEIRGKNQVVTTPKLKIRYGSGSAQLDSETRLKATDNISSNFSLILKQMDFRGFNAFLPPLLSEVRGSYEGQIKGVINNKKTLTYSIESNLSASNGELKNLNLSSFILPLIEKLPFAKGKVGPDKLQVTDRFDKLSLNAKATEKYIFLNQFAFYGNNSNAVIKADGKVGMEDSLPSSIKASLLIKDIQSDIKKATGQSDVPVLLEGNGFSIMPQYKYTADKLTERAAKVEITKQKKKIQKKVDTEKKKLEEKLKNKAKDLLKGFKL